MLSIMDMEEEPNIVDMATMSELDEINPQDSISYNTKFFDAANEFIEMIGCESTAKLKGRTFANQIRECYEKIKTTAQKELTALNDYVEKLNQNIDSEQEVPRSAYFDVFADELIKCCYGVDADPRESYLNQNSLYNKIFKKFLSTTSKEASCLLSEMDAVIKQFDPELMDVPDAR